MAREKMSTSGKKGDENLPFLSGRSFTMKALYCASRRGKLREGGGNRYVFRSKTREILGLLEVKLHKR